MKKSIPFKLNDGLVYVEVLTGDEDKPLVSLPDGERVVGRGEDEGEWPSDSERPIGRGEATAEEAARDFSKSVSGVGAIAEAVMDRLTSMVHKPAEVNLEFGLKFKVDGNVVVAALSAEANYVVKMTWRFEEKNQDTLEATEPKK